MQQTFQTEQERFWAGNFGNDYTDRNQSAALIASNLALFSKVLARTAEVESLTEFGANVGMNLYALRQLIPNLRLTAVELNQKAVEQLRRLSEVTIHAQSVLDFKPAEQTDMVLCKGLLIHLDPAVLPTVYEKIYQTSRRYICLCEYYNPAPVEVPYRGHQAKLFKRDFAGDMLEKYPDLHLLDYGFVYRRDRNFKQDDMTWFLLEKSGR
jgi:pseudaminic acid biosynthesis-associated methylase